MDPLSTAYSCGSLLADVARLNMAIPLFVSKIRIARKDMDAVLRELASLQLCLNELKDDVQPGRVNYSQSLKAQINQVLANTETVVNQINDVVARSSLLSKSNRGTQWSPADHRELLQCRSLLETNRMALDLTVTMGTLSRMVDQRKDFLDRRDTANAILENESPALGNTVVVERNADNSAEASQFEELKKEIVEFRGQLTDWSGQGVPQRLRNFSTEAYSHTISLLEPYPNLQAEFVSAKARQTLSPSLSVSTTNSSSVFTKRSHSVSCSTTSTDNRSYAGRKKCPACTRALMNDEDEAAAQSFLQEQISARDSLQKQLDEEHAEVAYLGEEIARLQQVTTNLENEQDKAIENKMKDVVREKDTVVKAKEATIHALQRDLQNTSFYLSVKRKSLSGTIEEARAAFADWERSQQLHDPSMSTGAPDEDTSDITPKQSTVIPRKPMKTTPSPAEPASRSSKPGIATSEEKIVLEFSIGFVNEDLLLRNLLTPQPNQQKPMTFHTYKNWATIGHLKREFMKVAAQQSRFNVSGVEMDQYYITKVSQRYDAFVDRPVVETQALLSSQPLSGVKLLHGDKLRLMVGPSGRRLDTDRHAATAGNEYVQPRSDRVRQQSRHPSAKSQDENLPEVIRPAHSPGPMDVRTSPTGGLPLVGLSARRGSDVSSQGPNIVVSHSRTTSLQSMFSEGVITSQQANASKPYPVFEFRVDRNGPKLILKPKSLVLSNPDMFGQANIHYEHMMSILRRVMVDPVHFTDEDPIANLKGYIMSLLEDYLLQWDYDPRRVFLQVRSNLLKETEFIRDHEISHYASIWVMLKPILPTDGSHLGYSLSRELPGDHELWIEEPDPYTIQRLSFGDPNFRRLYAAQRGSKSPSCRSVRS